MCTLNVYVYGSGCVVCSISASTVKDGKLFSTKCWVENISLLLAKCSHSLLKDKLFSSSCLVQCRFSTWGFWTCIVRITEMLDEFPATLSNPFP